MPSFLPNFFNLLLAIPPEFIEETEKMPYFIEPENCNETELLDAKLECLRLAHSMTRNVGVQSSEVIITDAQKFWNFLIPINEEITDDPN